MKRENSLKGKKCFNSVYTYGRKYKSEHFKLSILRRCSFLEVGQCIRQKEGVPLLKIAIVVTKRFGKAYERNRAKRRVRAVIDKYSDRFPGNVCMSINLYGNINEKLFTELDSELRELFIKSGILKL